jgi:hypothetical protein
MKRDDPFASSAKKHPSISAKKFAAGLTSLPRAGQAAPVAGSDGGVLDLIGRKMS